MVSSLKIKATKTYSRKDCCEMFGWADRLTTFNYIRYRKKANFILGPETHVQPWNTKYYISGADLYRFIRKRRPRIVPLLDFQQ